VRILSGDRFAYVESIAQQLGISHFDAEQFPDDKLNVMKKLQSEGHKVAMVGDGINDAPVLAAADLSISLSVGTDLARASSDLIINGGLLSPLGDAMLITRKMMSIIRQNFTWAITYNIVAVPFSMAGLVQPWLAAIGMSLSSLVVVLNALRLRN
jgi:P-type Cu2+ transporter